MRTIENPKGDMLLVINPRVVLFGMRTIEDPKGDIPHVIDLLSSTS